MYPHPPASPHSQLLLSSNSTPTRSQAQSPSSLTQLQPTHRDSNKEELSSLISHPYILHSAFLFHPHPSNRPSPSPSLILVHGPQYTDFPYFDPGLEAEEYQDEPINSRL